MEKRILSLLLAACLLLGVGASALADGPDGAVPAPEVTEAPLPPSEEGDAEQSEAEGEMAPAPEVTAEPSVPSDEGASEQSEPGGETTPAPEVTAAPSIPSDEGGAEQSEPGGETAPAPEVTAEPPAPSDEEGAEQSEAEGETVPAPETTVEGYFINPVYTGLVSEDDLLRPAPGDIAPASEPLTGSTPEEIGAAMRPLLVARQQEIPFNFYLESYSKDNVAAFYKEVLAAACKHTGDPAEGDYLRYGYIGYNYGWKYMEYDDGSATVYLQLTLTYTSDAAQEAQVSARVAEVLAGLGLEGKGEYERLRAVYDYICSHVVYDYDHVEMGSNYPAQFSAYAALIQGTSVCQGYACLLYRMALEAGVDCRVISGIGNGGNHAWNIARIGSLYYDLDSTWDAPRYAYGYYDYFLRCHANFDDHFPSSEYTTAAWDAAYPMSVADYVPGSSGSMPGSELDWAVAGGTLTISGSGSLPQLTGDPWEPYLSQIQELVLEAGVTAVPAGAFQDCAALEQVTVNDPHCRIDLSPNTLGGASAIRGYGLSRAQQYADENDRHFSPIGWLGDIDGSIGAADEDDLTVLFGAVTDGDTGSLDQTVSDVTGEGEVDLKDVTAIYQHLHGSRPYFD